MKKFKWDITTLFWIDGTGYPDRLNNVLFTIKRNKHLVEYLNKNGCDVSYTVYDFSPEKVLDDSIHIPFKLAEYRRSEKINIVLKNIDSDFFSVIDGDCFFDEVDYDKVLSLYDEFDLNTVYNFDWKKLHTVENINFNDNTFKPTNEWSFAIGYGLVGGLGAFFVAPTLKLKQINGFDESFKTWGGEDGEALDRLMRICKRVPIFNFSPYHIPHFTDWSNPLYK